MFYQDHVNHADNVYAHAKWLQDKSWVGNQPNKIAPLDYMEELLLGLGLALREINFSLFTEPDEFPVDTPAYIHLPSLPAWDALTKAADCLANVVAM